ncbi:hypothetical protein KKIDH5335_22480 [Vibrio fluvialis]|nr:hypothetical protein KKIDH5335_22480 [Vibrio fluvialis]
MLLPLTGKVLDLVGYENGAILQGLNQKGKRLRQFFSFSFRGDIIDSLLGFPSEKTSLLAGLEHEWR